MTLIDDLTAGLDPASLLLAENERAERARDTWMRSQIPLSAGSAIVAPLAVVAPTTAAELAEAMKICRAHGAPMIPRGGGSGVVGGVLASADSVVLSTERMDGLRALSSADLTATFGAGTNGLVAEERVQQDGLTIGLAEYQDDRPLALGWSLLLPFRDREKLAGEAKGPQSR